MTRPATQAHGSGDEGLTAEQAQVIRDHLRVHEGRRWSGPEADRRDDCGGCGLPMSEHPMTLFIPPVSLKGQHQIGAIMAGLLLHDD